MTLEKRNPMRIAITFFLLSGFTMLSLACSQRSTDESGNRMVEPAQQPDNAKLVFSSLELDQTNRGSVNINGYDRHFSVTFPTAYDKSKAYPVVLFLHGCMCRPTHTEEIIKNYLDWKPRLESYKDDFITIKMSAFSEKKPETPQDVSEGGARGMWFWHKGLEAERDDYTFVDTLITQLLASSDINIDPDNIFGVGHSSGAIFLLSYVLGGPVDLADVSINDTYSFKAISVTGGSTFRKGIVDFKENTPDTLPSVLHIQGERDMGLWFNGQETGKSGINFLEFSRSSPTTIIDGLRDTTHGLTYSAWDENTPSNPSTLGRWAEHLNLEYSGYEDYSQYFIYNFAPLTTSEKVLVGVRIKECGHSLTADQLQSDFFRIFSQQNGDLSEYDNAISRDTAMTLC
jgi:poly(3-hydroxybutyrate) depolymerase